MFNFDKLRNKLIVFEGSDHAGKSTIARLLVSKLNNNNIPCLYTFQPGDNLGDYNSILNDMCKSKKYDLDPLSNLFAFLLDRSEHTAKRVIPALQEGRTVICDRWWYSTIAYQFYGKKLFEKDNISYEFATWMNELASHGVKPHKSFLFQRPKELIKKSDDNIQDLFEMESYNFKQRVQEGYDFLVKQNELIAINVDTDPEITLTRILNTF